MKKFRIMTIVGTRPEIIRLSRVIVKLDEFCDHHLVHTGQNYDYELNEIFFEQLSLRRPDTFLDAAGKNGAETISNVIAKVDDLLEVEKPEALLVLGDTNSCMAALPAKRRKIPIFHMEAGNRCFDLRVPEEINRRIVDHIADINLPYSSIARDYLLREGLSPERVIKTGSPMREVLNHYRKNIEASSIVADMKLKKYQYFVLSSHREENLDDEKNFKKLINVVEQVAKHFKLPIVWSAHPRTRKRLEKESILFSKNVNIVKPLGFADYIKLQTEARAVISDSGTICEEASLINFPAINLREAHERPESMEEAVVMMTGLNANRVLQALTIIAEQPRAETRLLSKVPDYEVHNVSDKVLRIILSYTDYVMRTVWSK